MSSFTDISVMLGATIRDAIRCLNSGKNGIALVVDGEDRLINTVTDGDVRRAIIAGASLESPIRVLLEQKAKTPQADPVTMPVDTERTVLLQIMQEKEIRHVPLLHADGRVAGLVTLDELLPDEVLPMEAVIMAGGQGHRLRPLTESVPKPMLPVGDKPLMEQIIEQLKTAGINRVYVTTHYKGEVIVDHFGDGEQLGINIEYLNEDQPLGTAGALRLMEKPRGPMLVVNGDVLTHVNYKAMLHFHQDHGSDLTVGVRQYDVQIPYGVLECDGHRVQGVREKPAYYFFVNAGIYLLEPSVFQYLRDGPSDMTEVMETLIEAGRTIVSFPILEYWLDIGRPDDYEKARRGTPSEGRRAHEQ